MTLIGKNRIQHLISPHSGPLLAILEENLGLSTPELLGLLDFGAIYHNRKRLLAPVEVKEGDYLRIHTEPKRYFSRTLDLNRHIISEEENFVVFDKPSGLPVHAMLDNAKENLIAYAKDDLGMELLVTHRLDIGTQGLVVLSKNIEFTREFNKLIGDCGTQKEYQAITEFKPTLGRHVHFMLKTKESPKALSDQETPNSLRCSLNIERTEPTPIGHLNDIQLETGRTHQIRAQLAALGAPIIGDTLYGGVEKNDTRLQWALLAKRLAFKCPVSGQEYKFSLPYDLPDLYNFDV